MLRPIQVKDGDLVGEIFPYNGFRLDVEIDFKSEFIGRQRLDIDLTPFSFKKICRARTFGFLKDVKQLWAAGRALGSSLENTVAIGDDRILNPEGLRYTDEFVRHKALDAVGDIALAGAPMLGLYRSYRGSHRLNSKVLHALYEAKDAWTIVEVADKPAHRYVAPRAEFGIAFAMPNFAPETALALAIYTTLAPLTPALSPWEREFWRAPWRRRPLSHGATVFTHLTLAFGADG